MGKRNFPSPRSTVALIFLMGVCTGEAQGQNCITPKVYRYTPRPNDMNRPGLGLRVDEEVRSVDVLFEAEKMQIGIDRAIEGYDLIGMGATAQLDPQQPLTVYLYHAKRRSDVKLVLLDRRGKPLAEEEVPVPGACFGRNRGIAVDLSGTLIEDAIDRPGLYAIRLLGSEDNRSDTAWFVVMPAVATTDHAVVVPTHAFWGMYANGFNSLTHDHSGIRAQVYYDTRLPYVGDKWSTYEPTLEGTLDAYDRFGFQYDLITTHDVAENPDRLGQYKVVTVTMNEWATMDFLDNMDKFLEGTVRGMSRHQSAVWLAGTVFGTQLCRYGVSPPGHTGDFSTYLSMKVDDNPLDTDGRPLFMSAEPMEGAGPSTINPIYYRLYYIANQPDSVVYADPAKAEEREKCRDQFRAWIDGYMPVGWYVDVGKCTRNNSNIVRITRNRSRPSHAYNDRHTDCNPDKNHPLNVFGLDWSFFARDLPPKWGGKYDAKWNWNCDAGCMDRAQVRLGRKVLNRLVNYQVPTTSDLSLSPHLDLTYGLSRATVAGPDTHCEWDRPIGTPNGLVIDPAKRWAESVLWDHESDFGIENWTSIADLVFDDPYGPCRVSNGSWKPCLPFRRMNNEWIEDTRCQNVAFYQARQWEEPDTTDTLQKRQNTSAALHFAELESMRARAVWTDPDDLQWMLELADDAFNLPRWWRSKRWAWGKWGVPTGEHKALGIAILKANAGNQTLRGRNIAYWYYLPRHGHIDHFVDTEHYLRTMWLNTLSYLRRQAAGTVPSGTVVYEPHFAIGTPPGSSGLQRSSLLVAKNRSSNGSRKLQLTYRKPAGGGGPTDPIRLADQFAIRASGSMSFELDKYIDTQDDRNVGSWEGSVSARGDDFVAVSLQTKTTDSRSGGHAEILTPAEHSSLYIPLWLTDQDPFDPLTTVLSIHNPAPEDVLCALVLHGGPSQTPTPSTWLPNPILVPALGSATIDLSSVIPQGNQSMAGWGRVTCQWAAGGGDPKVAGKVVIRRQSGEVSYSAGLVAQPQQRLVSMPLQSGPDYTSTVAASNVTASKVTVDLTYRRQDGSVHTTQPVQVDPRQTVFFQSPDIGLGTVWLNTTSDALVGVGYETRQALGDTQEGVSMCGLVPTQSGQTVLHGPHVKLDIPDANTKIRLVNLSPTDAAPVVIALRDRDGITPNKQSPLVVSIAPRGCLSVDAAGSGPFIGPFTGAVEIQGMSPSLAGQVVISTPELTQAYPLSAGAP